MLETLFVFSTSAADREDEPLGNDHEGVVRDHQPPNDSGLILRPKLIQKVSDELGFEDRVALASSQEGNKVSECSTLLL